MLDPSTDTALSLLALISAIACIASDCAGKRVGVYVFKPLTMLFVLALALRPDNEISTLYHTAIVAGLCFSLAGDVFLMLPSDRFTAGLASFLVAHLLYVMAFAGDGGFDPRLDALAPFAIFSIAIVRVLWPRLGPLRGPVLVYVSAIVLMAWQAAARWLELGGTGPLLACCGATLFAVSDGALAVNRFRRPFAASPVAVLGSYFPAQWLIALSVGAGVRLFGGAAP